MLLFFSHPAVNVTEEQQLRNMEAKLDLWHLNKKPYVYAKNISKCKQ